MEIDKTKYYKYKIKCPECGTEKKVALKKTKYCSHKCALLGMRKSRTGFFTNFDPYRQRV